MRCTQPPAAGTRLGAGWPLSPKLLGGRPLPCRRTGVGDVGGEKYSSLELDATATAGVTALSMGLGAGGGGAELSDESGGDRRARRAPDLVNIFLNSVLLHIYIVLTAEIDSRHS